MLISILALAGSEFVALKGATVHTFEPGVAPAVATVLIENDRILDIGPDVAIPPGAQVVDLTGLHLLPGLVDGMVNFDAEHDRLYVGAGVTLVRDVGNDLGRLTVEQTRDARERNPGPWIWGAGAVLDGAPPSTLNAIVLDTPAVAEQKLKILLELEQPPDYLTFLPGLPKESWLLAIGKAHASRRQVWGSLPSGVTLAEALAAGQDGFFHLDSFLPPGKYWDSVTPEDLAPAVELAAAKKIAVTPALALWGRALVAPKEDSPDLEALSPFYRQTWLKDAEVRRAIASREHLAKGVAIVQAQQKLVKVLHDRGVALVPGSATPRPWLFPGRALLDELSLWKSAGIPVEDCLRAVTAGACEQLGVTLRGTIKKAKIADLIAVASDPRADIGALYRPAYVVLRGRVFDRKGLDALDSELRAAQKRAREEFAEPLAVEAPELPAGDVILRGRVETRAIGVRVSAERFAVVRRFDGALLYCGRMRTPGQGSLPDTETIVQQVVAEGSLVGFDVSMRTGARSVEVHGETAGGRLNVSRKLDGLPVDNVPILQRLALVDCGSATAWLILGYHRNPGTFQVAFFENYDPATGPWELALDPEGTHLLRMLGSQQAIVKYDAFGLPTEIRRQSGNGVSTTRLLESTIEDGRGLPMSAEKKALMPKRKADAGSAPTKDGALGRPAEAGAAGPK
ncbi:MAG: hypothetical protein NTY35_13095 [Planctomycetota bacterium]|nr:hypothetical protein [Planctomycetota bacterium]